MATIKNRYDFVILFDVENGNPNGDPDAGNAPRIDTDTSLGLVTDVCLKRKIRNYVELTKGDEKRFKIYVKEGIPLNHNDESAYTHLGIKNIETDKKPTTESDIIAFMCDNFYDIRTFGAVMSKFSKDKLHCGQVRGPVQIGFARSIDRITPIDVTIGRVTVSTEKDAKEKRSTFGRKYIVPYGLYRAEGFISANLAHSLTGFSDEDLELLWEAILNMFEHDRSAARGKMIVRKLIIFKHDCMLGNAPAHKLFDTVRVMKTCGDEPVRCYDDYEISIDTDSIPSGIELIIKEQ